MGLSVFPAASGGVTQKVQEFTSTGTFTVPTNCTSITLLMYGAGGGAGGNYAHGSSYWAASGAGGGGTYFYGDVPVDAGTTYTVTIGAGGAGGTTAGTNGALGADSTFGSLATGYGGGGGGGFVGATVRGTLRGSGGGSSIDNSYYGRAGGGGNGHAVRNAEGSDTTLGTKGTTTTLYGSGGFGADEAHHIPGPGYLGRGGGGGNGNIYIFDEDWRTTGAMSIHGGAPGRREGTGYSAAANYAGGGGGTAHTSTVNSYAGGAGGSGFARITYWS